MQQYNERIERLQSDDGLRQTIVKQLETVSHPEAVWVELWGPAVVAGLRQSGHLQASLDGSILHKLACSC